MACLGMIVPRWPPVLAAMIFPSFTKQRTFLSLKRNTFAASATVYVSCWRLCSHAVLFFWYEPNSRWLVGWMALDTGC